MSAAPVGNVVLVPNWKPPHYEIWSRREYNETMLAQGRIQLAFSDAGGRIVFRIAMTDDADQPSNVLSLQWKGGTAKNVPMGPTPGYCQLLAWPPWVSQERQAGGFPDR
jgi:hypothetical protein